MLKAYGCARRALILGLLWAGQARASEHVVSIDFGARLSTLVMPQVFDQPATPTVVFPVPASPSTKTSASGQDWAKLARYLNNSDKYFRSGERNNMKGISWKALAKEIKEKAVHLNWAALISNSAPVVYVGEDHKDTNVKLELAGLLSKKTGFTHVAFEAIADKHQSLLNRYFETGQGQDEILNILGNWGNSDHRSYWELLKAAKRTGVRPIALGYFPREGRCTLDSRDTSCSGSDCRMAQTLASLVSTGKTERKPVKILVLIGSEHARLGRQPEHLKNLGVTSKSYIFLSEKPDGIIKWNEVLYTLSKEAGITGKRRFFTLPNISESYDGFIYMPEGL